jgi:hypothetical protein
MSMLQVLDKGYVRLVNTMGSDLTVVKLRTGILCQGIDGTE